MLVAELVLVIILRPSLVIHRTRYTYHRVKSNLSIWGKDIGDALVVVHEITTKVWLTAECVLGLNLEMESAIFLVALDFHLVQGSPAVNILDTSSSKSQRALAIVLDWTNEAIAG